MPRAAVGAPGVARDDPAMTVIPTTHSAWPVVTVPRSSSWVSAAWCCAASSACSATNDHLAVQNGRRLPAVPTPDWRNSADERASQGPRRSTRFGWRIKIASRLASRSPSASSSCGSGMTPSTVSSSSLVRSPRSPDAQSSREKTRCSRILVSRRLGGAAAAIEMPLFQRCGTIRSPKQPASATVPHEHRRDHDRALIHIDSSPAHAAVGSVVRFAALKAMDSSASREPGRLNRWAAPAFHAGFTRTQVAAAPAHRSRGWVAADEGSVRLACSGPCSAGGGATGATGSSDWP